MGFNVAKFDIAVVTVVTHAPFGWTKNSVMYPSSIRVFRAVYVRTPRHARPQCVTEATPVQLYITHRTCLCQYSPGTSLSCTRHIIYYKSTSTCRILTPRVVAWVMPRLHQYTSPGPDTCIPDEQLVSGYIYVDGYMLLVRDTCRLYLGDIITIHLCHGRLVSLCVQQQTGDKLATILSPIQDACRRWQVDTTFIRQHVSWCKRGIRRSSTSVCFCLWFSDSVCLSAR